MIDLIENNDWLSLREASEKMGVSGATLRTWADEGRVESYRTPGGHRRFRVGENSALFRQHAGQGEVRWRLLEHAALGRVQLAREAEGVLNPTLPPQARTEQTELERALLHLVTYALPKDSADVETRATELGQAYGKWNWRFGVGLREAYLLLGVLRRAFLASVVEFAFGVGEPNPDELNVWLERANSLIDHVNVSMLEYRIEETAKHGGK